MVGLNPGDKLSKIIYNHFSPSLKDNVFRVNKCVYTAVTSKEENVVHKTTK